MVWDVAAGVFIGIFVLPLAWELFDLLMDRLWEVIKGTVKYGAIAGLLLGFGSLPFVYPVIGISPWTAVLLCFIGKAFRKRYGPKWYVSLDNPVHPTQFHGQEQEKPEDHDDR